MGLIVLAGSCTAAADPETEQLRAENLLLKAQLRALQQSCPAAQAVPPTAAVAPGATTGAPLAGAAAAAPLAPAATPAPVGAPTPVPRPPAAAENTASDVTTATAARATVVPKGYKLVPVNAPDYIDPLTPPYDRTGCSRALFKGPPPAKWNEPDNWRELSRGQSMADVEGSLGKEHFDVSGQGRVEWQYGKCGDQVSGRVQFVNGRVVFWKVPELD